MGTQGATTLVWLLMHDGVDFGVFVPFLGTAFGTNVLLSAVNVVYDWLDRKQRESAREFDEVMTRNEFPEEAVAAIKARRNACIGCTRGLRNFVRCTGIVLALLIALSLLLIHPSSTVGSGGKVLVALCGFTMPAFIAAMVAINRFWNGRIRADVNDRVRQLANASPHGAARDIPSIDPDRFQ